MKKLKSRTRTLTFLLLAGLIATSVASAREYFVSVDGKDTNNGTSSESAFATVQHGVNVLEPGDILTIAPGEYFEAIERRGLGSEDAETIIRAAIPGTVLIHGNVPVDSFSRVEGTRFVYAAHFDQKPYSVAEVDTLNLLNEAVYKDELEFLPGTFFYDEDNQMLYLSSTDLQSPNEHVYRVCVIPRHGLHLLNPIRVTVEGLAFTGFHFNEALPLRVGATMWGALLENARHSTLRNCTAYLNGGGLLVMNERGGEYNTIEYSTAYGNNSRHNNEGGNIAIIRGGANDVLRGNYVYRSPGYGQRFYISDQPGKLMEDSMAWGNESGDLWVKGVGEPYVSRRNTSLGGNPRGSTHSLFGVSSDRREGDVDGTNIFIGNYDDIDPALEFADPVHFDFRLQSTSRFRGAAEDGGDLGPNPYTGDILYVSPNGNDSADGLSVTTALATIGAAVERAESGFTIYLEGGRYDGNVAIRTSNLFLRGRGTDPVILRGEVTVDGVSAVELKRLTFATGIEVSNTSGLTVDNCVFTDGASIYAEQVKGATLTHNLFTHPVKLAAVSGFYSAGNIFAGSPALIVDSADGILYSDYNSYSDKAACWQVGDQAIGFDRLQSHRDRSSIIASPTFNLTTSLPDVRNQREFRGRGPLGTAIGPYFEGDIGGFQFAGPYVFSSTDTTINLEWWTSTPAVVELAWGETPALGHSRTIHSHNYGSYSLTGLKPGTTYYYSLTVLEPYPGIVTNQWRDFAPGESVSGSATTALHPLPARTLHVSTGGSDSNDGLSEVTAWRTVNHAARQARPGDTVVVAGGRYSETVWLRNSGESGRPITFRGSLDERTLFDGSSRRLFGAFYGVGKRHLIFDAFYAEDLGHVSTRAGSSLALELGGMFTLAFCDDVRIQRSLMDGRGVMYSPSLFTFDSCSGIVVENCVQIAAMDRSRLFNSPDIRVSHSVFFRDLISSLVIENHWDQAVIVDNCIFTDSLPKKFSAPVITAARWQSLEMDNNCFFQRPHDNRKNLVFIYGDAAFERVRVGFLMGEPRETYPVIEENTRLTIDNLDDFYPSTNSIAADPEFALFTPAPRGLGRIEQTTAFYPDRLGNTTVNFNDFFATNPEIIKRGIGLQAEAFKDFNFSRPSE